MAIAKTRIDFSTSEEGLHILQELKAMDQDSTYNTEASYSANKARYPDNLIPFVDKHMTYLERHSSVNTLEYLSNLKLMTRKR